MMTSSTSASRVPNSCVGNLAVRSLTQFSILFTLSGQAYSSIIVNLVRFFWSAMDQNFETTRNRIEYRTAQFQAEAQLAGASAAADRHREIKDLIITQNTSGSQKSLFLLPFPRNVTFCGRESILREMRTQLASDTADNMEKLKSFVLHGIGGVGKTQIALEYTYRYRDLYSHIFWIRSETETELIASYSQISKGLQPELGSTATDSDRRVAAVQAWLHANSMYYHHSDLLVNPS